MKVVSDDELIVTNTVYYFTRRSGGYFYIKHVALKSRIFPQNIPLELQFFQET